MDAALSVAVIDDHEVVRRGLSAWLLEADPPIGVLDGILTVDDAIGCTADVVVLDLQLLPGRPTLDGLQRLADAGRRVVVYTQVTDAATAVACIDRGALAYVTKVEAGEHLVAAIHAAASGEPYTPPTLSGAIAADSGPDRPDLSIQELAALRAWFASRSKVMAARSMGVKPATLHTYIDRARAKYAASGRPASTKSDMVRRALEDGLVTLADLDGRMRETG